MKHYNHLNQEDRLIISTLFFIEKRSMSYIAKIIGKNKSTISRELKRNTFYGVYYHTRAQRKYIKRRYHRHMFFMRKYKNFTELFLDKFNKRSYGVEATINYIKMNYPLVNIVSPRQVFRWIKNKNWCIKRSDCLRRKYYKGRRRKYGIFKTLNSKYVLPIWVRGKIIDSREEFGHWEADLVIGKRQSGYSSLLTLVERKTRHVIIEKVRSKYPHSINSKIKKIIEENNLDLKTLTIDNGIEFSKIGIAAYWCNFKVYYCEPYASYQRGSNENVNGLIRRWYKKGFDFNLLSDNEIKNLQNKINSMPRKMFNFKSSYEMYSREK